MGRFFRALLSVVAVCALSSSAHAQGFLVPGVGPINQSMGGAATAAPLDGVSAMYYNPATITGLPSSRFDISLEVLSNRNELASSVPGLSGSTGSKAGMAALPAIGAVWQDPESPFTLGLGLFATGGFLVNFPASPTNPLTAPPPVGMGNLYAELSILQIAPTLAFKVTDNLSFGIAPTIDVATARTDPFPFVAPNADGRYPSGTANRNRWGGGIQAGVYYETDMGLHLGAAVKSPQWFETFEANTTDAVGLPRTVTLEFEYPMIVNLGAAYSGLEDFLFAVDVRWVDYASTPTFGDPARFNPDGSIAGLGWKSTWVVATGVQYQMTDRLALRAGYSWNENPISDNKAFFSAIAPAVYQHILSLGMSYNLTESVILSATWVHTFENSVSGPLYAPGPVPGTNVKLSQEVDGGLFGISVLF